MVHHNRMTHVKLFLFGFNFTFVLIGMMLIRIGAVTMLEIRKYDVLLKNTATISALLTIVAGALVFMISFVGSYGAIRENYYMTLTFSVLLFAIMAMDFATSISAFCFKDNVEIAFKDSFKEYSINKAVRDTWDELQQDLKCCGVEDANDWGENVPNSCCEQKLEEGDNKCRDLFQDGCWNKLEDKLEMNTTVIGISGVVSLFTKMLIIVLACLLAWAIGNK